MKACRKFRQDLLDYVDGRSDRVREHLAVCERCAQAAEEMIRLKSLIAALPSETAPDGFEQAVRNRVRLAARPLAVRTWGRRLALAGSALAIVCVVGLLRPWQWAGPSRDLTNAEAALVSMTALHSQVQLAYVLPADSPLGTKAEAPRQMSDYDELYDLEGM